MALAVVVTPDVKVLGASEMLAKLVTGDTFSVNPVDVPSLTAMASGLGVDMAVAQAPSGIRKWAKAATATRAASAAGLAVLLVGEYNWQWLSSVV